MPISCYFRDWLSSSLSHVRRVTFSKFHDHDIYHYFLIDINIVAVTVCIGIYQADFTPLMFCAYHGHPLVAEALITAGCDVNASASVGLVCNI